MALLTSIPLDDLYTLLAPITVPPSTSRGKFSNWGQTFHCAPLAIFEPENEYQCELILELARREKKVVRAAGIGHSPSDIACTKEFMLRTQKLNRVLSVNVEKRTATVQAGITLNELHAHLADHGLAMMNVGSISDQTVGGIVTTATHGSGVTYGVISTHVMSLKLLLADGTYVTCSRHERPDLFVASICGLGTTGLILNVELEVEPAFRLKEVAITQPFEDVMQNLDEIAHAAEHVRLAWIPAADRIRVGLMNRTREEKTPAGSWFLEVFLGFYALEFILFLGRFFASINNFAGLFFCWLGGSRGVRVDDSHRVFNLDCLFLQYTTEWAIPYTRSQECLRELHSWLSQEYGDPNGLRPHFPIEIRFSAADDIWLSPSQGQKTCWIGIVQFKPYGLYVPYKRLFDGFEAILARHGGRPHWAKAHSLRREKLRSLYPHFDDFIRVLEDVDPCGLFRNEYIQRHFFDGQADGRIFKLRQ
ncbi:L-gulonolactone D-arabinono-1,4-lactone oxidase [Desarmillaria tabescens]|uniref:D-arabinono-1,4-lactone oxidase n=1 Tax=Armillaria tabescens TaxID=1929756 RepID=A0AA39NCF0_ARMTA|nr:L-gulonolactone D-arabinono-1,4-lactone oxidase [Desarmillaria tabescens]KAK0463083.1 L-gulonolactone D-arabinono-1,4-lactone oxidase [Desarmillaria tabescens]